MGFAVVQYAAPEEAEETQNLVHGFNIRGHKIRVTYCIPGQEAAKVYERLISVLVSLYANIKSTVLLCIFHLCLPFVSP